MPDIRATALPLTLLVAWVLADHKNNAVAANYLALFAHRFDRRSYLHDPFRLVSNGVALAAGPAAATSPWFSTQPKQIGRERDAG